MVAGRDRGVKAFGAFAVEGKSIKETNKKGENTRWDADSPWILREYSPGGERWSGGSVGRGSRLSLDRGRCGMGGGLSRAPSENAPIGGRGMGLWLGCCFGAGRRKFYNNQPYVVERSEEIVGGIGEK